MFRELATLFVIVMASGLALGQVPSGDRWIRVQSDDGVLSVEVPSTTVVFANEGGFFESEVGTSNSYHLKDMKMLSGYFDGTSVILESYDASKGALDTIYGNETRGSAEKSVIKKQGYNIRQALIKTDRAAMLRQFFTAGDRIYILTTASRGGISQQMQHFLNSVELSTEKKPVPNPNVSTFAKLPKTEPVVEVRLDGNAGKQNPVAPPITSSVNDDPTLKRYEVLYHPRAAYVDSARKRNVTGSIIVKITLGPQGYVSRIVVVKTLPEGLLRQVLLAALRIKFLPKEKDGKAAAVIITREYAFSIY